MKRLFILILALVLSFGILLSCSRDAEGLIGEHVPAGEPVPVGTRGKVIPGDPDKQGGNTGPTGPTGQQGLQLPDDTLP